MRPTVTSTSAPAPASALPGARRAMWLKQLHQWHWISSALCLMAMLLFSITGFLILKYHAANRPSTWPVIGFGIVLPAVIALLFVH